MPPRKKPEEPKTATELAIEEQEKIAKKASKDAEDKLKLAELQAKNQAIAQQEAHAQQHARAHPHSTNANYPFGAFGLNHGVPHLPVVAVPPHQPLHHPQQVQTSWSRAQHQDMQEQEYWQDQRTRARNTRHGNVFQMLEVIGTTGITVGLVWAILKSRDATNNLLSLITASSQAFPDGITLSSGSLTIQKLPLQTQTSGSANGSTVGPVQEKAPTIETVAAAANQMAATNQLVTTAISKLSPTTSIETYEEMINAILKLYCNKQSDLLNIMLLPTLIIPQVLEYFTTLQQQFESQKQELLDKLKGATIDGSYKTALKTYLENFGTYQKNDFSSYENNDFYRNLKQLDAFAINISLVDLIILVLAAFLKSKLTNTRDPLESYYQCIIDFYRNGIKVNTKLTLYRDNDIFLDTLFKRLDVFTNPLLTMTENAAQNRVDFLTWAFTMMPVNTQAASTNSQSQIFKIVQLNGIPCQ